MGAASGFRPAPALWHRQGASGGDICSTMKRGESRGSGGAAGAWTRVPSWRGDGAGVALGRPFWERERRLWARSGRNWTCVQRRPTVAEARKGTE